jgi:molecular chaperone Hsp33
MNDSHRRFLIEGTPVRGGWVRLDQTYREVLSRHDYPPVLRRMLGELLAATALLSSNLKFKGSIVVQLQSPGPLQLLVVECTDDRGMRAIAKWNGDLGDIGDADTNGDGPDLQQLAPGGRCVITLDPRDASQMYQGIVALEKGSIAELLEHHMQNSEQLATRLWLAADGERAAGMLLQKLPTDDDSADALDDDWNRVTLLASTVRPAELLDDEPESLLQKLFAGVDVRLFKPHPVRFACACSEARVANALLLIGQEEVEQVLAEQGQVEVACEFCNRKYSFDRARALGLFARPEPTTTLH